MPPRNSKGRKHVDVDYVIDEAHRYLAIEVKSEEHRTAARVRAAVAYAGRSFNDVANQSGVGVAKLRRIASAADPRGAMPLELWKIADACGVPRAWLEVGQWDDGVDQPRMRPTVTSPFGEGDVESRLEIIERYLFALLRIEEMRGDPLPLELESSPRPRERARPAGRAKPAAAKPRARRAAGNGG